MGSVTEDNAKLEILKRLARYKRPPTLKMLRHRLARLCGGEEWVEELLTDMIRRDGTLAVANGFFYRRNRDTPPAV